MVIVEDVDGSFGHHIFKNNSYITWDNYLLGDSIISCIGENAFFVSNRPYLVNARAVKMIP